MPRPPRLLQDQGWYHLLTRGNNRQVIFHDHEDFQRYGRLLLRYFSTHQVRLFHYCLMSNHVHLVVHAQTAAGLQKAMHGLNLSYALAYRHRYGGIGHFWQDRFKSVPIASDSHGLLCGAYVELNPVRARMMTRPDDYPWSSYRVYAAGQHDPLVCLNPLYAAFGATATERQRRYRQFVEAQLVPAAAEGRTAAVFQERRPWLLDRPRGRPRKALAVVSHGK